MFKGIYFLYNNNEIVYVGKSNKNIISRVCDHLRAGVKEFDSYDVFRYDVSNVDLSKIEEGFIRKHKPFYNKTCNIIKKRNKIKKPKKDMCLCADVFFNPDDLITPSNYAKLKNVTRATVYNWVNSGKVAVFIIDSVVFLINKKRKKH